jgi:hypothetical protein
MENNEVSKEKDQLKEVRETFYSCRDVEISNLWQRSIFLGTFIVLIFTGYGVVLMKMLDGNAAISVPVSVFHLVAMVLSIVGIILSILWIMMAKGSKAWQELYEHNIYAVENRLNLPEEFIMGNLKFNKEKLVDCIFLPQGGRYSPSKINIAVGQLCLAVWIIVLCVHFVFVLCNELCSIPFSSCLIVLLAVIILLAAIVVPILLFCCKQWVKSGYLNK